MNVFKSFLCTLLCLSINSWSQWNQMGSNILGTELSERAGKSVSISGNGLIIAVGSPGFEGSYNDGRVRVFQFDGTKWFRLGADIRDPDNDYSMGGSIELSEDGFTIVIANNQQSDVIRVYHFEFGGWNLLGEPISGQYYGPLDEVKVDLNAAGDIVAVGSPDTDNVRAYKFVDDEWIQLGDDIVGELSRENIGSALSLSDDGNTLVVGFANIDTDGEVKTYQYEGGNWMLMDNVIHGNFVNGKVGTAVSLSGDATRLAVGYYYSDDDIDNSGRVQIYEFVDDHWVELGSVIDGESEFDSFGKDGISLDRLGNVVAIGAKYHNSFDLEVGVLANSGHVKVYEYLADEWIGIGESIKGKQEEEYFGSSVDLNSNGTILIAGAVSYDDSLFTGSGRAAVFSTSLVSVPELEQEQKIKIYPNPFSDFTTIYFGEDVIGDRSIVIYDFIGQEMYRMENVTGTSWVVKNDQLLTGIYLLSIIENVSQTEIFSTKLIVQ